MSSIVAAESQGLSSAAQVSMEKFWAFADTARTETEYRADNKLMRLADAPLSVLQKIFIQYRYFTIFYISDLALLVAKLPFGNLRSLLADFLNDELGNGCTEGCHAQLYDDFLMSIGVHGDSLDLSPNHENIRLLQDLQNRVHSEPTAYGIGLRGMGGECLCQVYLSAMHSHFIKNPHIQRIRDRVSWTFWDIHTGDIDIAHREKLKLAIRAFVTASPDKLDQLASGYKDAKSMFERFWGNIYADHLVAPESGTIAVPH